MSSPTGRLLAAVLFTVVVIGSYATYTITAVRRMRQVQSEVIDQNRKAALQLLRIQNDLNALALAMRDMLENTDGYPLTAWTSQLDRIRENLDDAIAVESRLSGRSRDLEQTKYLLSAFAQFWKAVDQFTQLAREGQDKLAREFVRQTLLPRQEALTAMTSRSLVQNNEAEQLAATGIVETYSGIERNAYGFLALSIVLVLGVGVMTIRSNRALFERVNELSKQRGELAQQLIATQESTLRTVSRDLHDEFGQILTAIGAMLKRAGRSAPEGFQEQLRETSVVVQETLEKVRALSQSLQPVILEEQGLGPTVQWYLTVFQRQTGIVVDYTPPDTPPALDPSASIHVFRVLQEALNNVVRHAKVTEVSVLLAGNTSELMLVVEDRGAGIPDVIRPGVGLAGMRERAALLGGSLTAAGVDPSGTRITLTVPLGGTGNG